jgi:hypothetical protein
MRELLKPLVSKLHSINDRIIIEYGAVGGMRIGRGNQSTWRKPEPVPLCPPQILHDLAWHQTQAHSLQKAKVYKM